MLLLLHLTSGSEDQCPARLFPMAGDMTDDSSVVMIQEGRTPPGAAGCSSASCACGDKGKWSDSSLLGKRLSEDSGRHQLLQKWASMWSSVSGDASVACTERTQREEAAEPAEEEDRPLVFLCSRCRRPLGDSLSWVTSQEDTNCILLRCEFRPRKP
ncbi:hypothetical protein CB1_000995054 [Camelus ferus]|nr:hypothetical protein CB1_000995054 [Camelus ferus]